MNRDILEQDPCNTCEYEEGSIYCKEHCPHEAKVEQEPCDNCKYLDGDGCRLVFEQAEYGEASDECPDDIAISPCEDSINRKIIKAFLSGLISNDAEREKALQYVDELPPVNPQPCEDTISRQAAIKAITNTSGIRGDALNALYDLPPVNPQPKTGHFRDSISRDYLLSIANKDGAYGYVSAHDIINAPCYNPKEPKTEWIPVSERLPEKNDIYVVWTSKGFGDHLSTSYYSIDDGWTIEVCAWKENGEPYKESEDKECTKKI